MKGLGIHRFVIKLLYHWVGIPGLGVPHKALPHNSQPARVHFSYCFALDNEEGRNILLELQKVTDAIRQDLSYNFVW